MIMIVDTLPIFYYGKWWAAHLQSFADLVFSNERSDVGLKKKANVVILLGQMRKLGQMKRVGMKEKPVL